MKDRLSKIPAFLVLRLISLLLIGLGLVLVISAPGPAQQGLTLLIAGIIFFLVGIAGPVRIIRKGAQIPAEIKQTIFVQAIVLPLSGFAFIFSGILNTPAAVALAYYVVGFLIMVSAIMGFYALSRKLPESFYIGEMLSIIKSAGITGDKKNSPANRELMRWTKGDREGVSIGEPAPDGVVITMQDESTRLSSFFAENPAAPLVLNFASYTCPHYRKRIAELNVLMQKWQNRGVRFLTVYTAEAHTEDGWKLAHQYDNDAEFSKDEDFCFYYASSIDERRKMAKWLIEKKQFKMPVVLDSIGNDLLKSYNSWPIRLYIITHGKVAFCGKQGPFGYDPARVDAALKKTINSNS